MSEKEEKMDWKAKYEEAMKLVEALKRQLQTKETNKKYEERSEIDTILKTLLGDRPSLGGGSALRWDLCERLIKQLYRKKEGDYRDFIGRFAWQSGLTERKLEYGYMKPLEEQGVIEVFMGQNGIKWKWIAKVK